MPVLFVGYLLISRRALARWHSLCVFVNRWALAPGPNSLANSLYTKPGDSDKGFKGRGNTSWPTHLWPIALSGVSTWKPPVFLQYSLECGFTTH